MSPETSTLPLEPSLSDIESARRQIGELIEKTQQARPASDADLLLRAYDFAREKHAGQKRRTGDEYIEHPIAVAGILAELGMDDTTIAAGLLHDVPEDCAVTFEEMLTLFGREVAQLVEGVTKLKQIDFSDEQQKQAENLRKLFLAMADDVRVIIIKLADRLHNIRTLEPFPEKRKREIAQETISIFAPIAHRLGIWRVKWELEDRCFKFLEPSIYQQINVLVQRTRSERGRLVQRAIEELQTRLREENIQAEVAGRAKHFYSIYQKMVSQGLKFDKIHDLTAIRVICNTNSECYHVLGVVHSLWMQVPEMFFDYISKPKPNNYQSLHTKVLGPDGELLEVQIRTKEMHREAEYGIAAHWRYKSDEKPSQNFGDKLRWLRLVLELQNDTEGDAQSFMDFLTLDLAGDQVFAFTPDGDVIYLPKGSTPVDFAFRVHTEIGHRCTGAKVNARIVPLNYKLHNGDICEIVTSRSSRGPKRGWLEFVATPHAKNRIKSFLKKQNAAVNVREGRARLEKAARAERLKLGEVADNKSLLECARALGLKSADELLAGIGYGEYSAENILNRIRAAAPNVKSNAKNGEETLSGAASALLQKRTKRGGDDNGAQQGSLNFRRPHAGRRSWADAPLPDSPLAQLDKVAQESDGARTHSNLLYTLAKCCAPIPGDAVRGYVTRGRGVTVHRIDCANLHHYETREPHRLLEAEWVEEVEQPYQTLIAIEATDRVGLLNEVTRVIAEHNINISGINTYPLKNKRARLNIAITIKSSGQLDKLIAALGRLEGVSKAHRV